MKKVIKKFYAKKISEFMNLNEETKEELERISETDLQALTEEILLNWFRHLRNEYKDYDIDYDEFRNLLYEHAEQYAIKFKEGMKKAAAFQSVVLSQIDQIHAKFRTKKRKKE